jgi:hypothetical protein
MTATRHIDPRSVSPNLAEKKLTWLGTAGGYDYATLHGTEYAVDRKPSEPGNYIPREGEHVVSRAITEEFREEDIFSGKVHTTPMVRHRSFRATPVPSGTYAKLAAKTKKRPAEKPMPVWDNLAALRTAWQREPARIQYSAGPAPVIGALRAALGAKDAKPWIEVGARTQPERSPSGYVALLRSHGVQLDTAKCRLIVRSRKPISLEDRTLIEATEPLLIGELDGKRVLCSFCALEAVTTLFPHAPACAEHAG